MEFNIGNLVSGVMGAVAKVANAVVNELSPVAEGGGLIGGIAGALVGVAEAVLGVTTEFANAYEDGEIDEDEAEELLEDLFKLLVGASIVMFGSGTSEETSDINPEQIVISGNKDNEHATRNFIETAIKQIKDWKSQGKENITWIVTNSGYTEKDIERMKEVAKDNDVNIMFIDDADELYNYINAGEDVDGNIIENRTTNKITDVSIFSHGLKDQGHGAILALDYNDTNNYANSNLNISSDDLNNANINKDSFSSDVHTYFAACNAGTVQNDTSFANEWVKNTGGEAEAICDPTPEKIDEQDSSGQTSYAHINNGSDSKIWRSVDWIERSGMGINFDEDGCDNYPTKGESTYNEDLYWTRISEDGSIEKIDQGGPRK